MATRRLTLEQRIDNRRKEIHSDRLSMSLGELEALYERDEIDLHPKFQRVLRWSDQQKTRLIESLLLRIPIPPLFVAQDASGRWDVVDGVQRLGTCFEFLGVLVGPDGKTKEPLVLKGTQLLPELANHAFEPSDTHALAFPDSLQRDFRRLRVDINIILKESDESAKYELFERLNTGGSTASFQEVRNCVLVWIDEELYDWMKELSGLDTFVASCPVSERLHDEGYRDELVLRMLTLGGEDSDSLSSMGEINSYLNRKNRSLSDAFPKAKRSVSKKRFDDVFRLIGNAVGEDAFRRYDATRGMFNGPFLISAFEAIALGVWHNHAKWQAKSNSVVRLAALIKKMWNTDEFTSAIGVGRAAQTRIPKTIAFGRKYFIP